MQCRWKAKGCSIGGIKLYEGTANRGEACSGYPDLRIIGVRDLAIVVVDKLFTCPVSFELVVGVNQVKATAPLMGDGEDSRKDRDNVPRAVKEKGCHLREGKRGCRVCFRAPCEVKRWVWQRWEGLVVASTNP